MGAGPVGLEMAVRAVRQGLDVCLIERGSLIAANVREWQHVELFSPWSLNMSATGKEVLKEMGAAMPDDEAFPTGAQLISEYLQVLLDFLHKSGKCRFKFDSELVSIGRGTFLKKEHIGANGRRKGAPFRLLIQSTQSGQEEIITDCNFLVDCTGTWNQPNFCGAGGRSPKSLLPPLNPTRPDFDDRLSLSLALHCRWCSGRWGEGPGQKGSGSPAHSRPIAGRGEVPWQARVRGGVWGQRHHNDQCA